MDGNGNCWCFNGFLLAKSGWRLSYFKVGNGDWGHNFANLVIKTKGACHQTARYTSNGTFAENGCLWRGFQCSSCWLAVQVWAGVDGLWANNALKCGLWLMQTAKMQKCVHVCVWVPVKLTPCVCVCASRSVSLMLSVQAYCLSVCIR